MHPVQNPTSIRALFVDFPGFPDLVRGFPFPQPPRHILRSLFRTEKTGMGGRGVKGMRPTFIPRMNDDKWRRLSRGSLLMSGLNNFAGPPYRRKNMLRSFVGYQKVRGMS